MLQLTVLDPVEVLQLCPERRCKWISYSAYDAKATWQLSQALQAKLKVQRAQPLAFLGLRSALLAAALACARAFPAYPVPAGMLAVWSSSRQPHSRGSHSRPGSTGR